MKNKFICTSLASVSVLSSMSSGNFENVFLSAEAAEPSDNSKVTVGRLRNGVEISNYKEASQIIVTFSLNGDKNPNYSSIIFKVENNKLEKEANTGIDDVAIFSENSDDNVLRVTLKDEYTSSLKEVNCTTYSIQGEQNSKFPFGTEYNEQLKKIKEEAIQELKNIGLPDHILNVKIEQVKDAVKLGI